MNLFLSRHKPGIMEFGSVEWDAPEKIRGALSRVTRHTILAREGELWDEIACFFQNCFKNAKESGSYVVIWKWSS
jgi:hypothetical protein